MPDNSEKDSKHIKIKKWSEYSELEKEKEIQDVIDQLKAVANDPDFLIHLG